MQGRGAADAAGGIGVPRQAGIGLRPTSYPSATTEVVRLPGGFCDSRPPIYAVYVDGHLLYASGQDDVQMFLWTAMGVASRQVLRSMADAQPATLVFTCGTESVVIEVHLA